MKPIASLPLSMSLILLVALGAIMCGCGREACYAKNDVAFQKVVDDCDKAGFVYEECPWLEEAERIQKAKDARCP